VKLDSFVQLYSSKTDDELLALASSPDSLVDEARPILADELRRRDLVVKPGTPEVEHQTSDLQNIAIGKLFRSVGAFLLNLAFAVLGTATIESSIWSLIGHAHSVSGVETREWLLSITIAASLGFFIYRRRPTRSAVWVWILPVTVFAFVVLLHGTSSSVLSDSSFSGHFLAPNDLSNKEAFNDFFIFTIPAARTMSYSLGAWVSLHFQTRPNKASVLES
jgi:hypothetical protein